MNTDTGALQRVKELIDHFVITRMDVIRKLKRDAGHAPALALWQKAHKDDPEKLQAIIDKLESVYEAVDAIERKDSFIP